MSKEAEEFLRQKGLIKKGFKSFIIAHPLLGKIELNELLQQYADQEVKKVVLKEIDTLEYIHKTLPNGANKIMLGSVIEDLKKK